jgi:hypothetical protein
MYFLIVVSLSIMVIKLLLDYSQLRFFKKKFNELVRRDREKALNIMSKAIAKEIVKTGGGGYGR